MRGVQNYENRYLVKRAAELREADVFILNYNRYLFKKFVQENEISDTAQWGKLGWLHVREIWTGEDRIISTYSQYPFIVEVPGESENTSS